MSTVYVNLAPERVVALLSAVPAIISGVHQEIGAGVGDVAGAVRDLQLAVGTMAMSLIKEAFIVKSRGGTDEAGITWAKLDPRYVAYGRRHPGLRRKKSWERPVGLLTQDQDDRWRKLFGGAYHGLVARGDTHKEASRHAAAFAWVTLKAEGAKTILGKYGNAQVEIGRDTGRLFNSLGMAIDPSKPGTVTVGTNVIYAGAFHKKRPMWPEEDGWPAVWLDQLTDVLLDGVIIVCRRLLAT
jgi:hypothetical protein